MEATTPRERPILFSAPMVRAIIAGTKTQTRRSSILDYYNAGPSDWTVEPSGIRSDGLWRFAPRSHSLNAGIVRCPYGVVGDRLWVRETIAVHSKHCEGQGTGYFLHYRADDALRELDPDQRVTPVHDIYPHQRIADKGWRPSIHMPRWACRIVVEITEVRVQRLQDINEDDARAEGVEMNTYFPERWSPDDGWLNYDYPPDYDGEDYEWCATARDSFASLWRSINGAGSWDANPWVWVLTFKRAT